MTSPTMTSDGYTPEEAARLSAGQCLWCEEPLPEDTRRETCSDRCRKARYRARTRKPQADLSRPVGNCLHCGKELFRKGRTGPVPRYCNASCRRALCTERARADGRYAQWVATSVARKRQTKLRLKDCRVCGESYECTRDDALCPSEECRRVLHNLRARGNSSAWRARRAGAEVAPFSALDVFERDDYQCYLCDRPTTRNLIGREAQDPTVDHVIAVENGGPHRIENAATAHVRCNQVKGRRTAEEARVIISELPPVVA